MTAGHLVGEGASHLLAACQNCHDPRASNRPSDSLHRTRASRPHGTIPGAFSSGQSTTHEPIRRPSDGSPDNIQIKLYFLKIPCAGRAGLTDGRRARPSLSIDSRGGYGLNIWESEILQSQNSQKIRISVVCQEFPYPSSASSGRARRQVLFAGLRGQWESEAGNGWVLDQARYQNPSKAFGAMLPCFWFTASLIFCT